MESRAIFRRRIVRNPRGRLLLAVLRQQFYLAPLAAESAGWLRERAERFIERYKLNDHPPLLRARSEVWNQCKVKIDEMETLLAKQQKSESPTRKERIRKLVSELKEMTRRRSQFSSVAHGFIDQDQRAWVKRCAA